VLIPEGFIPEGVAEVSQIFLRDPHVLPKLFSHDNIADVTVGKPIAVLLQPISGVSTTNPLVAFYGIHRGKREVLFFYCVPETTRDYVVCLDVKYIMDFVIIPKNNTCLTHTMLRIH
jgi:hypothetical protein